MHGVDDNLYELEKLLKQGFKQVDNSEFFKEDEEESKSKQKSNSRVQNRSNIRNNQNQSKAQPLSKVPKTKTPTNIPGSSDIEVKGESLQEDSKSTLLKSTFESPYHKLLDHIDKLSLSNYLLSTLDGKDMKEFEKSILNNLLIPGQNRHLMPVHPENSLPVRKSDINEITSFSTIGAEQMQRALILKDFEDMMGNKESEREWKFFNRNYIKAYSKDALKYELSRTLL